MCKSAFCLQRRLGRRPQVALRHFRNPNVRRNVAVVAVYEPEASARVSVAVAVVVAVYESEVSARASVAVVVVVAVYEPEASARVCVAVVAQICVICAICGFRRCRSCSEFPLQRAFGVPPSGGSFSPLPLSRLFPATGY
jgi:hypothetical protein